jgi:hypothetical protein
MIFYKKKNKLLKDITVFLEFHNVQEINCDPELSEFENRNYNISIDLYKKRILKLVVYHMDYKSEKFGFLFDKKIKYKKDLDEFKEKVICYLPKNEQRRRKISEFLHG